MRNISKYVEMLKNDEERRTASGYILMKRLAIECMEKQIPKVPCYSGDSYYNGEMVIDTWECPCCGKQYEVDYDDYKYCPNCGQCIDHSTLTEDD